MKSQVLLLLRSLLTDVKRLQPEVRGLDRDLNTIEKRTKYEGLSFITKTLPTLLDSIMHGVDSGRFICPSNFKRLRGVSLPIFLSGLTYDLFDPTTGEYRSDASHESLESLRQICSFCKKMQPLDPDVELRKKAIASFHSTDELCSEEIQDETLSRTISSVSKLVLCNLDDYEDHAYRHGPGAVFESYKGNQKWKQLYAHLMKMDWVPSSFDMFVTKHLLFNEGTSTCHSLAQHEDSLLERVSRLSLVPKTSKSMRTISLEPLLLQFQQQGCNDTLRKNIERCPILSSCLDLTDQRKNQQLAMAGSISGDWSTIDLKSASDLLSVTLVKKVFADKPRFLEDILDCRSTHYTDEQTVRPLRKYAGMGNATTFPVQSVCFAIVSIASILIQDGRIPSYRNCVRAARSIRVFGDDIIIKSRYSLRACQDLSLVGLQINYDKSFFGSDFKESCGLDAFKGYDVTPIYLKFNPDDISRDVRVVQNLVSCSNALHLKGYYRVAHDLKQLVERQYGALPLVRSSAGHLGWESRFEAYSYTKWCKKSQQFLVRGLVPRPSKRKDRLSGYPALLKFFLTPKSGKEGYFLPLLMERGIKHLEETSQRYSTRVTQRWVTPC